MNKIYSLLAQDGKLKKIYEEYKHDISCGTYFEPTEHKIEGLHHLYFIITELRKRDGDYCFIRGNPNSMRLFGTNSWRRVKHEREGCFTYDEPKNWAMLDIDELVMRDEEEHNFETLRARIVEEIDFIDEDTAMLIDFSSSAQLSRKGEKSERIWKAHIYVWFEQPITSNDLYYRLRKYDEIDCSTVISNQIHFFEEPKIDPNYWDCGIQDRTRVFEGKKCKLPLVSRASLFDNEPISTTIPLLNVNGSYNYENALYQATQAEDGRYRATFRYFLFIVNSNKNKDEAIRRVWEGGNSSEKFKTKEDLEKKMEEARRFILKSYLPTLHIGNHKLINLNTDNVSEKIEDLNGVILVKSPQATYKTQTLKQIPKDASVLLITHRISLAQDISRQLNLFLYSDAKCNEELIGQTRLAITHHSLKKLINQTTAEVLDGLDFDYVIIDESEQLIEDVMTTTLLEQHNLTNRQVFQYVGQFVQRAKNVYLADADLSDLTRLFLEIWRKDDEKFTIYENDYRLGGKTVYGCANANLMLDKIYEDLRQKKRIFITCETKKGTHEQENNIRKKFPNANIISINGGEEKKRAYKEIFADPNKELALLFNGNSRINNGEFIGKKLDVLIVNSVMDTGFSIGRKEDMDNRFHSVYGFFDNSHLMYTGSKMRQALRRVRNADRYYVYILNKKEYVRNFDEILDNVYERSETGKATYDNLMNKIYKSIHVSKQNRKMNFIAHLEDCGWRYQENDDVGNFKEFWKEKHIVRKEEEEKLLNAEELSEHEYNNIVRKHYFGDELAVKKFTIEKSFNSDINLRLIKRFKNGKIETTRKILERMEKDANWIAKEYGRDDVFIVETLKRVFSQFGLDATRMLNTSANEIILWSYQIDNEIMDFLFAERNAETLTNLLNEKYGLSLSATNFNGQENDKLKFFVKVAKAFDFDCTLKDKNVVREDEQRQRVTFSVLKKHLLHHLGYRNENGRKVKRKDPHTTKTRQILERIGGEAFSFKKDEYIQKLKIAISERKEIRDIEIAFLKDQESHIIFRGFEIPQYTRFLSNFIRQYENDIPNKEVSANISDDFAQPTGKEEEERK